MHEVAGTASTWRPSRRRLAAATVLALALVLPVAWTLASPGAVATVRSPMAPEPRDQNESKVNFTRIAQQGDERFYEMDLSVPLPMDLVRHREIHIKFSQNDMTSPHPASGRLTVVGTECAFDMQPNAHINGGIPQVFLRNDQCVPPMGRPTGELVLTVRMGGPGELGLYTSPLLPTVGAGGLIYVAERSELIPVPPPALTGAFVDELPDYGLKRANLLAYMWSMSVGTGRIWFGLAVIAVLAFAGAALMPIGSGTPVARRGIAVRSGVAAFMLALALAMSYALMVPPFQAADEPHHFASYAGVTASPRILTEALSWAGSAHTSRIRGLTRERFRPQDMGQPHEVINDFQIHPTFARSSLSARAWQALGRVLPEMSAKRVFLAIRLINATLFAAAVGAAAALFVVFTTVAYPQLLAFPFLFVPALPFFGMHFGESALVTSVSVLFAATVVMFFLGGRDRHWLGLLLGVITAGLVIGARNSLPMMPLVATALVLRIVLPGDRTLRSALIFWGGFGLAASLYWAVITQAQLDVIRDTVGGVRQLLPDRFRPLAGWLTQPWFPLLAAATGCLGELAFKRPLALLTPILRPVLAVAAKVVPVGLTMAIFVSLIGSLWWEYPILDSIQGDNAPMPLRVYLEQLAKAGLSSFRFTRPDLLLSSSFWVGFGWLDTMPGQAFVGLLVGATAISVVGLLLHIARHVEVSRFVALVILGLGLVLTLAGYAYAAYAATVNLHGRYLVGWYLTIVALFWTWPAVAASRPPGDAWPRAAALAALVVFVHAYSLTFILRRYF